jgi:hypothetical protein
MADGGYEEASVSDADAPGDGSTLERVEGEVAHWHSGRWIPADLISDGTEEPDGPEHRRYRCPECHEEWETLSTVGRRPFG